MRGAYLHITEENKKGNLENVYEQYGLSSANGVDQHPKTVTEMKITAISCEDSAEMTVGEIRTISSEVTPAGTNDLLVWTTDNDKVAVVSNGRITAKSAGTATITAYALNTVEYGYYGNYNANPYENAVKKEIKITVKNTAGSFAVSGSDCLELTEGSSALLDISCGGALTYISDNEEVATVNSVGRVFGKSAGEAVITATAPNGEKKTVKIDVKEEFDEEREYINVGIFVLYNDAAHGYWDNEIGETVQIEENGTYTLTYDIAKHQSKDAKSLGIDTINNLTAIYLKDVDVHSGAIPQSAFRHCRLKWEKVEINGQEMKLSGDRKIWLKPINTSGVFDSGSPVNAWEGSDIEGVAVSDHTAVFTDIENPTCVTITFTISQIMYSGVSDSFYIKTALADAEKLDTSYLSAEGAEEFQKNVKTLKELFADETTHPQKLLNSYAKVKTVIDDVRALKKQESKEKSEKKEAPEAEQEEKAEAEETEVPTKESGGSDIAVIVGVIAAAAIAAVLLIITVIVRQKKKTKQ